MQKQDTHIFRPSVEEMCAGMHYLFAYPYPFSQKQKNKGQHALLTYSSENTTIGELSKQFKKIFLKYKTSQHVYFTLSKGYFLQNSWTIAYLKKLLRRTNIDGIQIYIESQDTSSEVFINQHGSLEQKLYLQPQFNSSSQMPFQIKFVLPSKNRHLITINGFSQQKTQLFIHKLFLEIKRQFQLQIDLNNLKGCFIRKNSLRLIQNIPIQKNEIMSGEEVEVCFFDSNLRFDIHVPLQSLNKLKIYDLDMEIRVLNYDLVKYQTFSSIYKTYFGKDIPLNKVYLKIMNVVVSQDETIEKAEQLFQQAAKYTKIVVSGYVINQKMLFDIQIYNSQKVAWKAFDYDDRIKKKINKFIKQKKIKLSKPNLKDQELLLQLIYLYTSETIKDGLTIYQSINEYLRKDHISLRHQQEWKYSFVNNFIKNMHLLKNVQRIKVYRGVNYRPKVRVGDKILFKSFTSTSKDIEIAYQHPIEYNKRKNNANNLEYSLFIMKIEQGKSLSEYSIYEGQEQVLIEPYSQFQIQKIDEKQYEHQQIIYPFVIYTLKQIKYNLNPLKDNKSTYILWIDDKLQQGKFLYEKIEQGAGSNIQQLLFKQFTSTFEFTKWLQTNQNIVKDNSAHVLVISNMKRNQNGKVNEKAGLHCLNELLQYTYKIPFIFYVRNTKATKSHLKQLSFAQAPTIHVTQYQQDLIRYIKKYTPLNIVQQQDSCSVQ